MDRQDVQVILRQMCAVDGELEEDIDGESNGGPFEWLFRKLTRAMTIRQA